MDSRMAILKTNRVNRWPKLAWVASMEPLSLNVHLYHGPFVETNDTWACEAVWVGDFQDADFDTTDLVFGTGVRCREDKVVFVSSGTMMDRLWHCRCHGQIYVSNSLPSLLAISGVSLREDYQSYPSDINTQRLGLNKYCRKIPGDLCDLHITYFRNLIFDGKALTETNKRDTSPEFICYGDYREFLTETARRIGLNLASSDRVHKVVPLTSVSQGYDSSAAAVIARESGCTRAVTITNASSLFPRSDSGKSIAESLEMTCHEFRHTPVLYRDEETIWAVAGSPAGLNLTVMDYPEPLSLFFTGYRGDTTWCRQLMAKVDRNEPFSSAEIAGLGLCEFRLVRGFFHCVVPFWGSLKVNQLQAISNSQEMAPWSIGGTYDRLIPRRILEEAGVSRTAFGIRKKATTAPRSFFWPFTSECMTSFREYLQKRGLYAPSQGRIQLLRRLTHADQLITTNLNHLLGTRFSGLRPHFALRGQQLLFHWANHTLKQRYASALPTGAMTVYTGRSVKCRRSAGS
jgi:hypothetical protein